MSLIQGTRTEHVKRGDPERLAREAAILTAVRHPGVVEVVGQAPGELRLARVDGPTLETGPPLSLPEVAGVVAAVAEIVADLHHAGVAHGAIEPSHVIIGLDGGPVLCGFGRAATTPPCDDVKDLGQLLDDLIPTQIPKGMTRPAHALRTLAQVATHPNPDRRPTARELADAITDEVHGARLPITTSTASPPDAAVAADPLDALRSSAFDDDDDDDEPRRLRRAATVAAVILVGCGALIALRPAAHTSPPSPSHPLAATKASQPPETSLPVATKLPATCPVVTGPLRADVDGDGCDDGLRFDAGVLQAEGSPARWAVGQPGDVVATGLWGCAPSATLALLRPATGEVFAFTGWAGAGHATTAAMLDRVAGAMGLRSADVDGDGCDDLVVTRPSGDPVTLHPRPSA
ncbi:MAG: eukaryotic-like serine/threonine-protein kinase [Actinomycetota bacterium]|jgi:hypothetical protein|nr:eukaryotic-like serine/threonine-protein kinase [Actinomycetota bacterium]